MTGNLTITGDEARILMQALMQSSRIVQLYLRLNEINLVQPPKTQESSDE